MSLESMFQGYVEFLCQPDSFEFAVLEYYFLLRQ